MKKVVLLASAVAAGMAVAPQAANAAAPEINDVQEIQSEDEVRRLMIEMDAELGSLEGFQLQPEYAKANVSLRDALTTVIGHMRELRRECDKMVDDLNNNSDYFVEKYDGHDSDHIGNFNAKANGTNDYADWVGDYMQGITISTGGCFSNVTKVFENQQKVAKKACSDIIKSVNANVEAAIVSNPDYTHLVAIKNAAKAIVDGNNNYYTDTYTDAVYSDIIDAELTAHFKGAIESVDNFIAKVAGASEVTNQFVDQHALETQLVTLRPELEGLLLNFKEKANEAAYKEIEKYVDGYLHEAATTSESDGTLIKTIKDLTHHLANTATCFDKTSSDPLVHDILKETKVANGINKLKLYIATLNNEWDALISTIHTPLESDKVLYGGQEPPSVNLWYQIKNIPGNKVDTDLKTIESNAYKACLTYDLQDIKAALDELAGTGYTADLNDGTTEKGTAVDSDLQDWLDTYLTDTTEAGTLAKEWFDLDADFTNNLFMGDISAADFATAEAKVDKLEKTIANLKANWTDIESLNDDLVDLKVDLKDATEKDGYDSAYIKDQWENATTGELKHYTDLLANVETAIDNVTDVETSWVGADEFADEIALENDHHDWLDQYQKENYDAKQDMLAAIDVRKKELDTVTTFAITSDDPEAPMTLADGTELYTTDTNKDRALAIIKGEDNTSKFIYQDKFFNELREHFYNGADGTLETTPVYVTDGNPIDLKNDQILAWYNDGDAQYIVKKTYDATWKAENAKREGELINNTVEGLQITTSTLSATGILVMNPEVTTEGNEVVFGWLQKEIQNAFAKAVENEKANKDLHDQIDACEAYVKAAQDDIDDNAVLVLNRAADEFDVYDIYSRTSSKHNEAAISKTHDIKYTGTDTEGNYAPVALPESYKAEGMNVLVNAATPNYVADFTCGHSVALLGWTNINVEINKLWNKEKEEYDNVASKALLDAKTIENKIDELEENVDDIKNEAFTQVVKNGFAEVQKAITAARNWARTLDNICDIEDTPCSEEDVKNNPCGWDDPTAKTALQNLINTFNTQLAALTSSHNNEQADKEEEVEGATVHTTLAGYETELNNMLAGLMTWQKAFAAADMKHKKALNDALDQEVEEAHTLHHYAEDANHAAASFTEADKKAADLWAQDFNLRENDTSLDKEGNTVLVSGEKITFQAFMERLLTAVGHGTTHPNPDKLANAERVAAAGIKNFQDYIEAMDCIEELLNTYAKNLYDHHLYTDLKNLSQGLENFNWKSDYMEAINANNAAKVELLNQLAQAQATLDAAKNDVIADKNEVYPVDYDALTTTDLKAAQDVLDAQKTNIEKAWKDGKAADYSTNGEEDLNVKGYKLNLKEQDTDEKNVIEVYVDKAQAAKNLYAANKLAKEELLRQVEAALTTLKADYEKADFTGGDQCMSAYKTQYEDLKAEIEALKTSVNNSFDKKFADITGESKTVETLQGDINESIKKLGQLEKNIADYNTKVLASNNAAKNLNNMIDAAFATKVVDGKLIPVGEKMQEAMVEGYENFQVRPTTPADVITNTEVKYFDEILSDIDALKAQIATDNGHVTTVDGVEVGGHVVAEKYADYLQAMANIQADLDKLVEAINANEEAHNAQIEEYNAVKKEYECYDTAGVKDAANAIDDPDFTGTYDEADDATFDHSTLVKAKVAAALTAYEDEIEKHYKNGASAVEAAQKLISNDADPRGKRELFLDEYQAAKENDAKFVELYTAINMSKLDGLHQNWKKPDVYKNENDSPVNSYSNAADYEVTDKYAALQAAVEAYLKDIKQYWYAGTIVAWAKGEATPLLDTDTYVNRVTEYTDALDAHKKAVKDAESNDTELLNELGMLGDEVTLLTDLHAEHPETSDVLTAMRTQLATYKAYCDTYATIKNNIVQDWEDEMLVVEVGKELSTTVAANRAAAMKYADWADKHNKLVAAINAYCADLELINAKQAALNQVKNDIEALEIYNKELNIDGVVVKDEKHPDGYDKDRKDLVDELDRIQGLINGINGLQEAADTEASTVKDLICDDNNTNDRLYVYQVADQDEVQSATATLGENAQKEENLFKENENAFDSVYEAYTFKYTDKEGTEVSVSYADGLHDTMLATKAEATDFTAYNADRKKLEGLALEAFDKFVNTSIKDEEGNVIVKSLVEQLEDEINALVTLYKAEDAASFDVKKYEELKNKIDYARSVAEGVDDSMGDICNKDLVAGQDGFVDEYDFMYLLDEMVLKNRPTTYDFPYCYGDLDLNGKYEANDLVLLSNYIWYKNLDGVQRAQANRGAFEAELNAEVVHNTVAIAIDNNYEFNALQFDVTVPEGARITDLIATTRAKGLVVASNEYEQNTYRVVIVGMGGNKHITGNEGNVISFNVLGAEGEVEIFNVSAANGISFDLNGASLYIGQTTDINEVAAEGETDIFSLDGIRQSVMKAGVNIVRGANGVAKKIFNK